MGSLTQFPILVRGSSACRLCWDGSTHSAVSFWVYFPPGSLPCTPNCALGSSLLLGLWPLCSPKPGRWICPSKSCSNLVLPRSFLGLPILRKMDPETENQNKKQARLKVNCMHKWSIKLRGKSEWWKVTHYGGHYCILGKGIHWWAKARSTDIS